MPLPRKGSRILEVPNLDTGAKVTVQKLARNRQPIHSALQEARDFTAMMLRMWREGRPDLAGKHTNIGFADQHNKIHLRIQAELKGDASAEVHQRTRTLASRVQISPLEKNLRTLTAKKLAELKKAGASETEIHQFLLTNENKIQKALRRMHERKVRAIEKTGTVFKSVR